MKLTNIWENKPLSVVLALALMLSLAISFSAKKSFGEDHQNGQHGLDHFKCYETQGQPVNDLVLLRDQFGMQDNTFERDKVEEPKIFCNPAKKILEFSATTTEINNFDHHLTWYKIDPIFREQFRPRDVMVKNQFYPNGQRLTVEKPRFLAVPTQKLKVDNATTTLHTPEGLDHFKCYSVRAERKPSLAVRLWDQFSMQPNPNSDLWDKYKVTLPKYLCNPTAKVHPIGFDEHDQPHFFTAGIKHPAEHLVCYSISPDLRAPHSLEIKNQFGNEQKLLTTLSKLLCVPSEKQLVENTQE